MGIDRSIEATYICPNTGKTETTTYYNGSDKYYDDEYPSEVVVADMRERGITSFVYSNDQDFSHEVEVFKNGECIFSESGGEDAEWFVETEDWILNNTSVYRKSETLTTTARMPWNKVFFAPDGRKIVSIINYENDRVSCYAKGGWSDDYSQTKLMYVHHTLKLITAIASEEVVACFKLFVEANDWDTVFTIESDAVAAFIKTQE